MKITDIDKNLAVNVSLPFDDVKYYNCEEAPFKIYGVFKENGQFRRLPEAVAKSVSDGVYYLHTHTAGGRIRFCTDSEYIAINAQVSQIGASAHCALSGAAGFDIYVTEADSSQVFLRSFIPPVDITDHFEGHVTFPEKPGMKEITVNLPPYAAISQIHIGVQETAQVLPAKDYKHMKPVVYYGSSITQGGCCARPGNAYPSIVSRLLDTDFINLGFSGNALAEETITDYIKNLDMSVFVMDYDHNAPDPEHLEKTHKKMFNAIRESKPDLPILIMPRPKFILTPKDQARFVVVKRTYDKAIAAGDKHVYFLDGKTLMQEAGNDGTVDNTHPNDLGFHSMAKAIAGVLKDIL